MIHSVHTLSIRQYAIIDKTNDIKLLRRWWNIFPVGWFDITTLINEISVIVNPDYDSNHATEIGRLLRYNKILLLESLHIGIYNLIVLKPDNDQWNITKKNRTNLIMYIKLVEKHTGIVIKDLKDLSNFKSEIERLGDKYTEIYKEQPNKGKSISFLRAAYSYFGIMEMDYNPDMSIAEFEDLKDSAIEKINYLESLKNKPQNG